MSNQRTTTPLILAKEVSELTSYNRNHLRRLEAKGKFPRRIRIGANRVAWVRQEIDDWLLARVNDRNEAWAEDVR